MKARSRCAVALVPLLLLPLAQGAERTSGSSAGSGKEAAGAASTRSASGEGGGVYHLLRRGQTLYSLSRAYGVSPGTLARVNGIKDPTRIPAGKRLFVPGATRILDLPSPAGPLLSWPIQGRVTSAFQSGRRPAGQESTSARGSGQQKTSRRGARAAPFEASERPPCGREPEVAKRGGLGARPAP